ncbi:MAG: hypothetical protein QT00_C0001G0231 [archaeon GW2011_AR5]|nr:MAG: hypothetical protein QT00_C0001G0231 [archaeon GW2011_AR5]MBS3051498.1 hypothetical protein [Candidatus Aenigmarchaeota archaeon]
MILRNLGDEVQGEQIICFFRKRDREILFPMTSGHRGLRLRIRGLPARAIIEKTVEFIK